MAIQSIDYIAWRLESKKERQYGGITMDYRCDDGRFWLSAHNCQVPTPTSQNL